MTRILLAALLFLPLALQAEPASTHFGPRESVATYPSAPTPPGWSWVGTDIELTVTNYAVDPPVEWTVELTGVGLILPLPPKTYTVRNEIGGVETSGTYNDLLFSVSVMVGPFHLIIGTVFNDGPIQVAAGKQGIVFGMAGNDVINGADKRDYLFGMDGNDIINGNGDNDFILGGNGDDLLHGNAGDDWIWGEDGKDKLWGEEGGDLLVCGDGPDEQRAVGGNDSAIDVIWGGPNSDFLYGDADTDQIQTSGGEDEIYSMGGGDTIHAGPSGDTIYVAPDDVNMIEVSGGSGIDTIRLWRNYGQVWGDWAIDDSTGDTDHIYIYDSSVDESGTGHRSYTVKCGAGDDVVYWGGKGTDFIYGEAGNDTLDGGESEDEIEGGEGDDRIYGNHGDDGTSIRAITGGDGEDRIWGGLGTDWIKCGAGNDYAWGDEGAPLADPSLAGWDVIWGQEGSDHLYGEDDDDTIRGGEANGTGDGVDYINGGPGEDLINGDEGGDYIAGDEGDDIISGDDGDDWIWGDSGNDTIYGWDGEDRINGGEGDDTISGGAGRDRIAGGSGNDTIEGNEGDDLIWGDVGNDTLDGGDGDDMIDGDNKDPDLDPSDPTFTDKDTLLGKNGTDTLIDRSDNYSDTLDGGSDGSLDKIDCRDNDQQNPDTVTGGSPEGDNIWLDDIDNLTDWTPADTLVVTNGSGLDLPIGERPTNNHLSKPPIR
jgi:Ca2+-binding RTX toxin-like protein